jgi:ketosteroid isomerase-like protein
VSREQNARIAEELLARIGKGADPDEIATLFSGDVQFEIAGDVGALPWIGQKTGRDAASDFFRDTRRLTQPVRFDVQGILADDRRAVILTIANLEITRFQMLEDSFAVSRAARVR